MSQSKHTSKTAPGRARAIKAGFDDIFYLVLIIAIVVVANLLLKDQGQWRHDLTDEKLYTLTDASKELARELPGQIEVKAFFSEGLQAPEHNLAQRVGDLLAEYSAASEGKIAFEMIFPSEEEDEERARGYGVEKIAVGQQDRNQVGLRLVYKGIAFVYGDKQEVIPEVGASDNLEYEITKALKNLVMEDARTIGILQGFGGPGGSPQFVQSVQQAFQSIYGDLVAIEGVDLAAQDAIPDHVDALVLLNVGQPVRDEAQRAIDSFLMQGKALALFQSPTALDPQMPQIPLRQPVPHGLGPMLEKYGVTLNTDLVIDREKNVVGLGLSARGLVQVSIPTLPLMTEINEESILTKDVDAVVFPHSGSITLTDEVMRSGGVAVTKLIESAPTSVAKEDTGDVQIEELMEPGEGEVEGPHLVAVTLQGAFTSAFEDGVTADPEARLLVVSNGEFLFPNQRSGYGADYARLGGLFFLNAMDWLVQDEALTTIRNKGIPRILEPVDPDTQRWLQLANIGGVPLGVLLLGLMWWGVRSARRTRLKRRFARSESSAE